MPYIKQELRDHLSAWPGYQPSDAGELNYILTTIIKNYFRDRGGRYQQINDVLGALEGAKMEFYRRIVAPYEDTKIAENGDVY
jgi:hypothetical protein